MKKAGNWTDQQDQLLIQLYNQSGCFQKWKFISENFHKRGFIKNQIQCRQRYVNKLNPQLRKDKLNSSELKLLFKYYDQYGPLWSVFQTLIQGRSQNLLKNKFYSTLRSLIRVLISLSEQMTHEKSSICSSQISSKILVEMYQGKKNFRKFKKYLSSLLRKLEFQIDQQRINQIKGQIDLEFVQQIKSSILKAKAVKESETTKQKISTNSQLKKSQPNTIITELQKVQLHLNAEQEKLIYLKQTKEVGTQTNLAHYQEDQNYNIYVNQIWPVNIIYPIWDYSNPSWT